MPDIELGVEMTAVVVAVTDHRPRILRVGSAGPRLPSGALDLEDDRTLERALRRIIEAETGLELGYVEQLYTLGDRDRKPEGRTLSVAYLALTRETPPGVAGASWIDWYSLLPWEDFRYGRPPVLDDILLPALDAWADTSENGAVEAARRERTAIAFGTGAGQWDGERALERFELLFEMGWLPEAGAPSTDVAAHGVPMALDHRRIAAQALGRLRGKLRYRPVVFELLPASFTLGGLQRVVEALSGVRLHTANFRRLVERGRLVEPTGEFDQSTGGRPAAVHRFRREVLIERPAPGVGLPGLRTSG